jgi:transcriptional regulator with GAF, ATPase, and Fis domain
MTVLDRLRPTLERMAASDLTILVLGETGVGKDVCARMIHSLSPRAAAPFIAVNCAAIAEGLVESELFGHERGAFTGAAQTKVGLFEAAQGGTIFLDEIGELGMGLQAKLLRVLENRELTRVGSVKSRPIDVRFICATNRDLEARVDAGLFRRDLFYRINTFAVELPPLRERTEEIPELAERFLAACPSYGAPAELSREALAALERHDWPGNLRELRNVIERASLLAGGGLIEPAHLQMSAPRARILALVPPPRAAAPIPVVAEPVGLRGRRLDVQRDRISETLAECGGNQTRAAKVLGISRRTLVSRLREMQLPRPRAAAVH